MPNEILPIVVNLLLDDEQKIAALQEMGSAINVSEITYELMENAIIYGHNQLFCWLLEKYPFAIDLKSSQNTNLLFIALKYNKKAIAKHIIQKCPNMPDSVNDDGETVYHCAVEGGCVSLLDECIPAESQQPLLNVPDRWGWYPIHRAIRNGDIDTVTHLLSKGVSIDIKTKSANPKISSSFLSTSTNLRF